MKRNLIFIIVLVGVFALTACGGTDTPDSLIDLATAQSSGTETAEQSASAQPDSPDVYLLAGDGPYWQAVYGGAKQAGEDLGVTVGFGGPADGADGQADLLQEVLAGSPRALAISTTDDAVMGGLEQARAEGISRVAFGDGVPAELEELVLATFTADNTASGALAAEELIRLPAFIDALKSASGPAVIGVLSQEDSDDDAQRAQGFADTLIAYLAPAFSGGVTFEDGTSASDTIGDAASANEGAAATGDETTEPTGEAATGETPDAGETASSAQDGSVVIRVFDAGSVSGLLDTPGLTCIFCTSEAAANALLDATNEGADLAEGQPYEGVFSIGFNSGAAQKNAVRQGWFTGAVTQDLYHMGYLTVQMAARSYGGTAISSMDTGSAWYTSANVDDPDVARMLYD